MNALLQKILFLFFCLPIFFFPLSTAAAGISGGIFILLYIISGYWKKSREITARPWFVPLTLLILWTLLGTLWSKASLHDTWIAISRLGYFFFAYAGTTLPWNGSRFRMIPVLFLAGLLLNWIVGLCQWVGVWPWHPLVPMLGPVGYANHIFLSMTLTMALLWIAYDIRDKVLIPRWANAILAGAFLLQLGMGAGRTGQLLFVILMPLAVWVLFKGQWRYWALGGIVLAIIGMGMSPIVQHRAQEGLQNLKVIGKGDYDTSWGLRVLMAQGALYMGVQHPILGVGTGNYANEMAQLQKNHILPSLPYPLIMSQPQNSYLIELAMLGIPGLLLFVWSLWAVTAPAWRLRATPEGWFVLVYMAVFITGSFSDTLIWGYANVFSLAILAALPIPLVRNRLYDATPTDNRFT
ncbi:MAG: O-antigen ligase domain-containing protein [Acidithiobacillus ferriphilus]|jgi:O-antigen ligase|uniref:O-antigen ligase family protein n=1 Tax=Acidithiobacillus ferriphilus TaxID=1689834 RepID=UPI00242D3150|nr:O-antigen ligase family protein [Acidithiobacillus ferriphilus]MBW9248323.1 O-antigen ligase domain-containing protein [Acidithiobacillus ferriphilus]MBW9254535.1 O-antigen ligase domain-containing protein [Acidithiobacillus ferriphilus]